jgi:hypothetical protein
MRPPNAARSITETEADGNNCLPLAQGTWADCYKLRILPSILIYSFYALSRPITFIRKLFNP